VTVAERIVYTSGYLWWLRRINGHFVGNDVTDVIDQLRLVRRRRRGVRAGKRVRLRSSQSQLTASAESLQHLPECQQQQLFDCSHPIKAIVGHGALVKRAGCRTVSDRPRCLRNVTLTNISEINNVNNNNVTAELPSLYIINPTSLVKNNAVQLLSTDTAACNADIILVTETWFKTHHNKSLLI